jgi:hypothetical protein
MRGCEKRGERGGGPPWRGGRRLPFPPPLALLGLGLLLAKAKGKGRGPFGRAAGGDPALATLRERYARGEIGSEEYRERWRVLHDDAPPGRRA